MQNRPFRGESRIWWWSCISLSSIRICWTSKERKIFFSHLSLILQRQGLQLLTVLAPGTVDYVPAVRGHDRVQDTPPDVFGVKRLHQFETPAGRIEDTDVGI